MFLRPAEPEWSWLFLSDSQHFFLCAEERNNENVIFCPPRFWSSISTLPFSRLCKGLSTSEQIDNLLSPENLLILFLSLCLNHQPKIHFIPLKVWENASLTLYHQAHWMFWRLYFGRWSGPQWVFESGCGKASKPVWHFTAAQLELEFVSIRALYLLLKLLPFPHRMDLHRVFQTANTKTHSS